MIIWYLLNEIHVQKPAIDYHADISCQAGSKFGLSLHLLPYFVYILGVQRYTDIPVNRDLLKLNIVSRYAFGCTDT